MDPELIETIQGTIFKIWQTKRHIANLKEKGTQVPEYLRGYLKWLDQSLNKTDAFDTLYIGCERFPQHDVYPIVVGGVM